ncbi:MAG: Crp/Fnr family transcriptional regulator [Deltaproteobacteria bacterium]|nr:Crp/Fnr family transcriptional regulator [Deltaproteobacteria bacterium]
MGNPSLDRYVRPCPRGTILFEEGQPGDRMYVIQSGKVEIIKRVGEVRFLLASLQQGDSVGEMALLDGQARSADAVVVEDATLLVIERDTFEQLIRENGEVAVRIMRKLSERLREANRTIETFVAQKGVQSAVQALRELAEPGAGPRLLPDGASPQVLAERAGLPVSEAQACWERLEEAGVLMKDGAQLLLAPDAQVDDYLAYRELKQKYDPMTVRELAEVTGLPEDEVHRVVRRVLGTRLPSVAAGGLVDSYQQFLILKRRFEYPERA